MSAAIRTLEIKSATALLHDLEPVLTAGLSPRIVVFLAGGQTLSGIFGGIRTFSNESWGAIQTGSQNDITFFSLGQVIAVTVTDLPSYFEKAKMLADQAPVTALEFRRKVSEKLSRLGKLAVPVEVAPTMLSADSSQLGRMLGSFEQLVEAFVEMTADGMGQEAFRTKVKSIHLTPASGQLLVLSDGRLEVDLHGGLAFNSRRWATEINPLL